FSLADLEPRGRQRTFGRGDGELNEAPHFFDFLLLDIPGGIEPLDLAGDLAGEGRRVKGVDARDSGAALPERGPGILRADSQRRHQANARHYNPAAQTPWLPFG